MHKASGFRCLVYHGKGELPCVKCSKCGEFVRPENMEEECSGPRDPSHAKFLEREYGEEAMKKLLRGRGGKANESRR